MIVDLAKHYRDNISRRKTSEEKDTEQRRIHSQISFPNFPTHPHLLGHTMPTMILPVHQDMMKHWTPQVSHNAMMQPMVPQPDESPIIGSSYQNLPPKFQPTYMHPS